MTSRSAPVNELEMRIYEAAILAAVKGDWDGWESSIMALVDLCHEKESPEGSEEAYWLLKCRRPLSYDIIPRDIAGEPPMKEWSVSISQFQDCPHSQMKGTVLECGGRYALTSLNWTRPAPYLAKELGVLTDLESELLSRTSMKTEGVDV